MSEPVSEIDWIRTAYDALPTKRWMLEDGEILREWEPGHRDTLLCYRKVPTPDTEAMFRSEADRYFAVHAPTFVKLLLRDNAQLRESSAERHRQMEEALRDLVEAVGHIDYFAADDGYRLSEQVLQVYEKAKTVLVATKPEAEEGEA